MLNIPSSLRWMILAMALAVVAILVATRGGNAPAASGAEVNVRCDTATAPEEMRAWIHEALYLSGIEDRDSLCLVRSNGRWVADFRNLPLWALPPENRSFMIQQLFPDSIRFDGASVCVEPSREVRDWLDRIRPDWKSGQRCSGAHQQEILKRWLAEVAGWIALKDQSLDEQGRVARLSLACNDQVRAFPLGRLLPLRNLQSLELEGCQLDADQTRFEYMAVDRLVLRKVPDRRLNLSALRGLDTLWVDGGRLAWLDVPQGCPIGRDECLPEERMVPRDIRLSRIPLCDPRLEAALDSLGAVRENTSCEGYPSEIVNFVQDLSDRFQEQTSKEVFINPNPEAKSLSERLRKHDVPRKTRWRDIEPGEFSCMRGDAFLADTVRIGEDWMVKPTLGTFYIGEEHPPSRSLPSIGASKVEVDDLMPAAMFSTNDFMVYGSAQGGVDLILHFDASGNLDALWFPQGCWSQYWLTQFFKDHEYIEEGE
ncbi:MAG: hypothetical protein IPN71_03955 [Fibrobacteres bacterium]|nr:hypothetical protein [Fibrobacterota bacterium]